VRAIENVTANEDDHFELSYSKGDYFGVIQEGESSLKVKTPGGDIGMVEKCQVEEASREHLDLFVSDLSFGSFRHSDLRHQVNRTAINFAEWRVLACGR